jgi:hypothetical protein
MAPTRCFEMNELPHLRDLLLFFGLLMVVSMQQGASTFLVLPGRFATLLLIFSIILGLCTSAIVVGARGDRPPVVHTKLEGFTPLGHVLAHAITCGVVATLFWLWAMSKVITRHDADLGAITFAWAMYASWAVQKATRSKAGPTSNDRTRYIGAAAIVGANYLYVLFTFSGLRQTFRHYLWIGAAFWLAAAYTGNQVLLACEATKEKGAEDRTNDKLMDDESGGESTAEPEEP